MLAAHPKLLAVLASLALVLTFCPPWRAWNGEGEPAPVKGEPDRTDRFGAPLPVGALFRLGTARFRPGRFLSHAELCPDGKVVAALSYGHGGAIHLFDAASGREMRRFAADAQSLAFAPDGTTLASAYRHEIAIWETTTGKQLRLLEAPESEVNSFAFSGDGKVLASGAEGMTLTSVVYAWAPDTGKRLGRFEVLQNCSVRVALSPHGQMLASWGRHYEHLARGKEGGPGEWGRTVQLWKVATGREVCRFQVASGSVGAAAFAPDGKVLAAVSELDTNNGNGLGRRTLHLWDVASAKELRRAELPAGLIFPLFAFSPDGNMIAAATEGHTEKVRLWDIIAGKLLAPVSAPFQSHAALTSLRFLPGDKILGCGFEDLTTIRLWDVQTGKPLYSPERGHSDWVHSLVFSGDGKVLTSADDSGNVCRWDIDTGKAMGCPKEKSGPSICHFVLSPNGRYVAVTGRYASVHVWDVTTGKTVVDAGWNSRAEAVAFSADAKALATSSCGEWIQLWEVASGRRLPPLKAEQCRFDALAFAPDGKTLAAISNGVEAVTDAPKCEVYLWDVAAQRVIRRMPMDSRWANSVAFSPDGKLLAVADGEKIGLWSVATGAKTRLIKEGEGRAWYPVFSRDGKMLAFAAGGRPDEAGWIHLVEVATGRSRAHLRQRYGSTKVLAFSPSGKILASGGSDTTVLLWDLMGRSLPGRQSKADLSLRELESLWLALRSADAAEAFGAIQALVAAPDKAISFLRDRLRPVAAADPQRVAQLITDLGSDRFPVRTQATAELGELGDLAESALRRVLAGETSAEQRRRADKLLRQLLEWSPDHLRALRAIEALELTGTREAGQVLHALAQGTAEARLNREAQAAVARLTTRAATAADTQGR